jgi:hypothetical protein
VTQIDKLANSVRAVSALIDIVKDGNPTEALTTLQERLQALRQELLEVREEVLALREQNLELKEGLAEATREKLDADRYRRAVLATGAVVFVEHDAVDQPAETAVYFCAHCLPKGHAVILQLVRRVVGGSHYKCPACETQVVAPNAATRAKPQHRVEKVPRWEDEY